MIELTYEIFKPGESFLPAFNSVFSQAFGGKTDAKMFLVARAVTIAEKEFKELLNAARERYKITKKDNEKHPNARAFTEFMEATCEIRFPLPILEPILVRVKAPNQVSAAAAAILVDVVTFEWVDDERQRGVAPGVLEE